jgi:hypothetical protein
MLKSSDGGNADIFWFEYGIGTMKKLIIASIAATSLAAAVPAVAQSYLDNRATELEQRIDARQSDGSLSYSEARALRSRLRDAERLQNNYEADGMSGWQQRALERRYDDISSDISSMSGSTTYSYRRTYHWYDVW